jgi:3-deoxy-D-manno-octulosonic-acid transferase
MIAERSAAAGLLETWGRSRAAGPLVWLHGASAGELLGAAPAVQALRRQTDIQLLVTHFSPSGAAALAHLEPDQAAYPPLDTRRDCQRAMAAVRPDALVYAKLDVWPGLTRAAVRAGVPVGMINAVVRRKSRRMRPLARAALHPVYADLSLVGAASDEDARRLRRMGVRPEALRVTGDASFDLAVARAERARVPGGARERFEASLPPRPPGGMRLVAGSTWPEDEDALLAAQDALDVRRRGIQMVIAPHQPTDSHLTRLLDACRRRGARAVRWSEIAPGGAPRVNHGEVEPEASLRGEAGAEVVAFDEIGPLAELYAAADLAYVGGGIGGTGLHNVLEPAAAAVPVLFGPRHDRREAGELVAVGGAIEVTRDSLIEAIEGLFDEESRNRIGDRGRRYVDSRGGAAQAGAELMLQLIRERVM